MPWPGSKMECNMPGRVLMTHVMTSSKVDGSWNAGITQLNEDRPIHVDLLSGPLEPLTQHNRCSFRLDAAPSFWKQVAWPWESGKVSISSRLLQPQSSRAGVTSRGAAACFLGPAWYQLGSLEQGRV